MELVNNETSRPHNVTSPDTRGTFAPDNILALRALTGDEGDFKMAGTARRLRTGRSRFGIADSDITTAPWGFQPLSAPYCCQLW